MTDIDMGALDGAGTVVAEQWDARQLALLDALGLHAYVLNLPEAPGHGGTAAGEPAAQADDRGAPWVAPVHDDEPWQADTGPEDGRDEGMPVPRQGSPRPVAERVEPIGRPAPDAAPSPSPSSPPARATSQPAPAATASGAPLKPVAVRHVDALPPHVASLDWPGLQAAVASCQACELCGTRQQAVFGVGHPQADWMIVGEAPGEQEDAQGEPFVGRSGQLLDAMLGAMGLGRSEGPADRQVFIANVIKCRPPANRNPSPDEVARCEPYLRQQVALVKPKLLLAMGRFAAQSLLQTTDPIGRLRGQVHHYQGIPVVVTYHPSYLLRSPQEKAKAWHDLCLAMKVMDDLKAGS